MTDQEIYNILDNSKKQVDALIALNIKFIGVNGQTVLHALQKIANSVNFNGDISGKGFRERHKEKELKQYLQNPKKCEYCGNIIPFKLRNNKCCSKQCAASLGNAGRVQTNKTKNKISEGLHKYYGIKEISEKECCVCHKKFIPKYTNKGKLSKSKTCSEECHKQLKIQNGYNAHESAVKNGTFKPWQSRKITSYAEQFWKTVLDNNNIKYQREFFFDKKYFLDFYIEVDNIKIDLEIDGKQHKYEDRKIHDIERDKYLENKDVIVYRIKWNDIKTEKGNKLMKEKIDGFVDFYNKKTSGCGLQTAVKS